ncbi:flavin monoamine oxidase family protein [Alteribacter aurantiacus]|uniref:flavin monoamine oxidase family protein n=1 Tax=Alteribacter aurantiacus TaxID=254410 RepID=UPI00047DD28B|nr:FAD-dependent oxidoreductase [Alteribacter aurantiacus]
MVHRIADSLIPAVWQRRLHILKNGLPDVSYRKNIIILGAGMAGLTAGYLLKQSGNSVNILEGNSRVGGRIHTIREPFSEGRYFDAGAMRIPNDHVLTFELIRQFSLPVNSFIGESNNEPLLFHFALFIRLNR